MSALHTPSAALLAAFLPVVRSRLLPTAQPIQRIPLLEQLQRLRLRASLFPLALAPIPSLLRELWDGILEAVPKKKTSHMKKRHRQMAGKALKDVTALNKCSACGRLKRAHVLCPYCVQSIRRWFSNGFKSKEDVRQAEEKQFELWNEELQTRGRKPLVWDKLYKAKDDVAKA